MIQELYPVYLQAGYSPESFWKLSFGEVVSILEAYDKRKTNEFKNNVMLAFNQARNIGEYFALSFGGKDANIEITQPWDVYPDIFVEEKLLAEQQVEEEKWEEYKERRANFAQLYNKKVKEVKTNGKRYDSSSTASETRSANGTVSETVRSSEKEN